MGVDWSGSDLRDQSSGMSVGKGADGELGQTDERVTAFDRAANGKEHHDALCAEPPGDEGQQLRGFAIEPLRVVDRAQQRPPCSGLGEQRQDRQSDEKAVRRSALSQTEG
jgi:hypothetical protein